MLIYETKMDTHVDCERVIRKLQANVMPSVIANNFDAMQGRLNI